MEDNKQLIFIEMKNVGLLYISSYISSESKLMFHDHSKERKKVSRK